MDGLAGLPFAALDGAQRHRRQRANGKARGAQLGQIAHAAIHHQARPAVARGRLRQVAADQGAAQRAARIDHQHPAFTGAVHRLAHARVVFGRAHGVHRAAKRLLGAKTVKHRRQHPKRAGCIALVGIAQIAGKKQGLGHGRTAPRRSKNTAPEAATGPRIAKSGIRKRKKQHPRASPRTFRLETCSVSSSIRFSQTDAFLWAGQRFQFVQ